MKKTFIWAILTLFLMWFFYAAIPVDIYAAWSTPIFLLAGILTAITVYITIVGFIYQIILRGTWQPTGFQRIIDELLHSVIPVLTIIFWYLFENKSALKYSQIPKWTIFPILYLIVVLIRGSFSGFYPYPFVDVTKLGFTKVLTNSLWISIFFIGLSMLYIRIGKFINKS